MTDAAYYALLKRIINGKAIVALHPAQTETWDDVYAGNVLFTCEGWTLEIFNDCGDLDYTDTVTAPDGRVIGFYEDNRDIDDPISVIPEVGGLTDEERAKLELLLKAAKPLDTST